VRETRKPEPQTLEWGIESETLDLQIRSKSVELYSAFEPSAKYERGKNYCQVRQAAYLRICIAF
jgi:hypothetical protein